MVFSGPNWSSVRIFNKDGTFITKNKPNESGQWRIGTTAVELVYDNGNKNTISLPLNPAGTAGKDHSGKTVTVVLDIPASVKAAATNLPVVTGSAAQAMLAPGGVAQMPAAGPVIKPVGNALDELMDRAAWTTEGVLAPLDAKLPPWKKSSKLHSDIVALRILLLDEAARVPAASPDTYKTAAGLCDAWLGALAERDKFTAAESGPMATADMQTEKPVNTRTLNADQLEQERLDMQKAKEQAAKQNAFFNEAQNKQWMQIADKLRPGIEQLFTQLGELRRQGAQPKPSAPPAGS